MTLRDLKETLAAHNPGLVAGYLLVLETMLELTFNVEGREYFVLTGESLLSTYSTMIEILRNFGVDYSYDTYDCVKKGSGKHCALQSRSPDTTTISGAVDKALENTVRTGVDVFNAAHTEVVTAALRETDPTFQVEMSELGRAKRQLLTVFYRLQERVVSYIGALRFFDTGYEPLVEQTLTDEEVANVNFNLREGDLRVREQYALDPRFVKNFLTAVLQDPLEESPKEVIINPTSMDLSLGVMPGIKTARAPRNDIDNLHLLFHTEGKENELLRKFRRMTAEYDIMPSLGFLKTASSEHVQNVIVNLDQFVKYKAISGISAASLYQGLLDLYQHIGGKKPGLDYFEMSPRVYGDMEEPFVAAGPSISAVAAGPSRGLVQGAHEVSTRGSGLSALVAAGADGWATGPAPFRSASAASAGELAEYQVSAQSGTLRSIRMILNSLVDQIRAYDPDDLKKSELLPSKTGPKRYLGSSIYGPDFSPYVMMEKPENTRAAAGAGGASSDA